MNFNLNRGISTPIALTIIIALAVILVGGLFAYQYYVAPEEEVGYSELGGETADWDTYKSQKMGFEIKYPKDTTIKSQGYYASHPFNNEPVAYFQISDNNQTKGYLAVNISDNQNDIINCVAPLAILPMDQKIYPTTMSINQVDFAEYNYGPGGVEGFTKDYKVVRNNLCFDIQITAFPSACISSGCENRLWSNQTERNLLNELDRYAKTFKFIN